MKILLLIFCWIALSVSDAWAVGAIVAENQLPGAPESEWDLAGPASTTLEGFATEISVNHGSTINFKIKAGTSSWKIDIYRLGYYQGNGARFIGSIPMSHAQSQPAPIVNAATGEVDAGNWTVTASLPIPANAVSGVYIAKLVDLTNVNNQSHIPFIVRADESVSDIVFQTSDTTWHAYNGWGGANLYGGNGPGGDSAPGRAFKVSYNRPLATRDGVGTAAAWTDFLFGAEYAAIYWLEQNGYDVSYIAEVDTSRSPSLLLQHKIFTSTGHDEYWDTKARANIEAARAAGVHLAFMSGNEVFWKTRWEPSIDGSATPNRTLVCYKETRANAPIDPLDANPSWTWTGTWRDPRFSPPADGRKPENALTGTIFSVDSYRSDAIAIPYEMSRLRFWRNSPNVATASPGATTMLIDNILGYEWDSAPDNGSAPGGLINLSSTTQDVSSLLRDYGSVTGNGAATHSLTLYKDATSGAIVFGAGTVFWSWGLSSFHDGPPTPTDQNVQQAMVNLFAEMGVQPATLNAPLIAAAKSADSTAPVSVIATPASGASSVDGQVVVISGTATDVGGRVAGVEVSVDNGATWRRASGAVNWTYNWNATAGAHIIRSRATDDSLNTETASSGTSITVATLGQTLLTGATVPDSMTANDASSVELGVQFSSPSSGYATGLRFYKNSINSGVHTGHLWDASGALLASATFVNETASGWQSVNFSAPVPITAGLIYTASYHTDGFYSATDGYFTSAATNSVVTYPVNAGVYTYAANAAFPSHSFHADNYWVDVVFTVPAATQASQITSALTASATAGSFFSYTITASSNPTSFNAAGLPAGLSVNTTTGVISGTPATSGTSSVTLSATNAVGTGTATLTLTISPADLTISLFSLSSVPAIVTVNDPSPIELGVKFSAQSAGSITGMRFYKGPQNTGTHTAHLWDAAGTLLASATYGNESASGWQSVSFASPVAISANTTYIASYHTNGFYSASGNFFATAYTNSLLTAPDSASSGGNGVYAYGGGVTFPSNAYNATNYWVDVAFVSSGAPATTITSPPTAAATVGSFFSYTITASNNPTSFNAVGLPAGLSVNTTTGVISGTPTAPGTTNVTLSATNAGGTATASLVLTINPSGSTFSLFSTSSVPAIVSVNDTSSVELGVKFSANRAGNIIGMRFYKGSQNTGVHTAHLWNAAGALLASATYANESASGWQSVVFASPVAISANTTYVASYHSNGFYSVSGAFFGAPLTNSPLTAPDSTSSGGNGIYAYGNVVTFPSSTYNANNYWVDVIFQ